MTLSDWFVFSSSREPYTEDIRGKFLLMTLVLGLFAFITNYQVFNVWKYGEFHFENYDLPSTNKRIMIGLGFALMDIIFFAILPLTYRLSTKPKIQPEEEEKMKPVIRELDQTIKRDVLLAMQVKVLAYILLLFLYILSLIDNKGVIGDNQVQVTSQLDSIKGPLMFVSHYIIIILMTGKVIVKLENAEKKKYGIDYVNRDNVLFTGFVYSFITYFVTLILVTRIIRPLIFLPLGLPIF